MSFVSFLSFVLDELKHIQNPMVIVGHHKKGERYVEYSKDMLPK